MPSHLNISRDRIAEVCRRHRVKRLSLFGSSLTDRFGPESDVDMLVEFETGMRVGYFTLGKLIDELSTVVGRRVDVRTPAELGDAIRADVIRGAEVQYAA